MIDTSKLFPIKKKPELRTKPKPKPKKIEKKIEKTVFRGGGVKKKIIRNKNR